ncbi:peptidoglycan-binding domain 1 protein [Shewanella sediminis HAW-EB3]|uniref:Peptidoglycan-binding domain 1 protein n=2 Tax=Shewanella TaxID=22 RepID=A8FW37_SHESH|nr:MULTISPECIES: L,D-transpeptidase family protein [Shewanella]ABV37060.1 peptidoglycan-binding domain 1 protein [Shewanella sediminis HAW-EB3]RTR39798.1 murein L,D-transpeptidase [Shewanella canadensis]
MALRNLVWLICTGFLLVLYVTPVAAMDRSDAGLNSLRYQLQLVNLVRPSKQSEDSYRILRSGTVQEKLDRVGGIQADLKYFWQNKNIPNDANRLDDTEDLYQRAISLEPTSSDYLPVSNRLRYLLWLSEHYPWKPLVIGGWLKEGDYHKSIPEISFRLNMLGDLDSYDRNNKQLNRTLATSLLRFQRRHGLKQDAIIGPETLRWLNASPKNRARLLANNFLKKSSYLASLDSRFLLINIPAFEMVLVDHDEIQLKSRVIVGKPYRQTPMLSSQISNVVLNPSWRVPRRLLWRDLLPKVRENGSYITQRNFDVFDAKGVIIEKSPDEWQELAQGRFPYRLVQRPGEENTLGRYKFYFANDYNVYLHDTVDKSLFEESNRALSSGCIRVENVESLANWMASNLVRDKQTWVDMQVERQKTQWFSLDDSLAVHLVYWTAWIDSEGDSQFRNDIYNQNSTGNLALIENR